MRKLMLLAAAGVGYVFGAKAGRERYEQIRRTAQKVRNDPRVQEKASQASDFAKEQAPVVKDKVAGAATSAAGAASSAAGAAKAKAGSGSSPEGVEQLHPESTARQDDPYPKGDLP